jgi:predicted dehydrogenase
MKKIGFVDYYISEWHANVYPAWIKEASEKLGLDYAVSYAWAEEYVSPFDSRNTDEWCRDFGVERCESIEELCEKSDVIVVLAPSNPEKHLEYASEVLKHGKRTYIDKTFAPDYKTARKIFNLGEKHGADFFSSSALRYSDALHGLAGSKYVTTFGGGSNFPEYAVHQCEMVIATMKAEAKSVKVEAQGAQYITSVKFEDGRAATMVYAPALSFGIMAEDESGKGSYRPATQGHFQALIADIINFFETGERSFDPEETLLVMKLREAALRGAEALGKWIEV